MVLALLVMPGAFAQAQDNGKSTWRQMPGTAADISINADGQAYVVGTDGTPWRWDRVEQRWRRMSGRFVRISAALGNRPWAVSAEGVVFYYNGLWWEDRGKGVVDVAADIAGNVYAAKSNGQILKWYALRNEWQPFDGNAARLTIDGNGLPWVVGTDGHIRSYDGKNWLTLPGLARDIAIGSTDIVVIADATGLIRLWNAEDKSWAIIDGARDATTIGVTPDGKIWAAVKDGVILANGGLLDEESSLEQDTVKTPKAEQPQTQPVIAPQASASVPAASEPNAASIEAPPIVVGNTPPAITSTSDSAGTNNAARSDFVDPVTITTNDKLTFINTEKTAKTLAIGADGSVFGLDDGGNILRWSNRKRQFDSFPGTLVRISVDKDDHPWGLSALGRVFRHDGKRWRQIYNATASDISVGYDGTVLGTNAAGRLFRLNAAQTRFEPVPGTRISRVATGPDGTPWTVRTDKLVQRCDVTPCKVYPQKANAISVGPDGSVFIVSDSHHLMRLNEDGRFDIVQTAGKIPADVAVGPMGYPWVVTDNELVLASTFFDRDESDDPLEAATTDEDGTTGIGATATVASSPSSFTFSKNITFDSVPAPGLGSSSAVLASDIDGIIWATAYNAEIKKYSPRQRKFVSANARLGTNQEIVLSFDIAPNGDIWAYADSMQTRTLLRERNRVIKQYNIANAEPKDVAVSPDGTVFAIFDFGSDWYLYSKAPNSENFTKFSNDNEIYKVSVGPGNDIWIIDSDNVVKQWTGKKFQSRPAQGQKAGVIAVGKTDGTVYIRDLDNGLLKWNGINHSFDRVNNISADYVAIDEKGRPWVSDGTANVVKRARN
ncbi:hypothetical protein TMES_16665 [Thalassospira mesophila]|uniref:Uncharacterized protein n=2 Tax=Thalassospira mesophila TaxID=1293891 RepID=A0A1Y2KWV4_9PROT|nr:hypothetical protein TMES_16665 [Thalassospira mesophila]